MDSRIIPVHISDDVSSLSAIALDNDFYDFMKEGRRVVDGISVLGAEYIIPFKMYAWINNRDLRARGKRVNTDDIIKHKNDVFRLLPLVNPDVKIRTEGNVRTAVMTFIENIKDEEVAQDFLYNRRTKEEILDILKQVYI